MLDQSMYQARGYLRRFWYVYCICTIQPWIFENKNFNWLLADSLQFSRACPNGESRIFPNSPVVQTSQFPRNQSFGDFRFFPRKYANSEAIFPQASQTLAWKSVKNTFFTLCHWSISHSFLNGQSKIKVISRDKK